MKPIAHVMMVLALSLPVAAARADGGAEVFAKKCAACHGKDGKGQTMMGKRMGITDLTMVKAGAAEIEKIVGEGKAKMPAFKGKLPEEEIKAVAAYVKAGLK